MSATAESRHSVPLSAFGHLLKRLRLGAELTQEELAERGKTGHGIGLFRLGRFRAES